MNVLSQHEMFFGPMQLAPARVPRLTPGMRRVLAAVLVRELVLTRKDYTLPDIMGLQYHGGYLTRTLKRLVREGCVEVHAGRPAVITGTRLGRIAMNRVVLR